MEGRDDRKRRRENLFFVRKIKDKLGEEDFIKFIDIVTRDCPYDYYDEEYVCTNKCGECFNRFYEEE